MILVIDFPYPIYPSGHTPDIFSVAVQEFYFSISFTTFDRKEVFGSK